MVSLSPSSTLMRPASSYLQASFASSFFCRVSALVRGWLLPFLVRGEGLSPIPELHEQQERVQIEVVEMDILYFVVQIRCSRSGQWCLVFGAE